MIKRINSKFEYRNSKQILMSKSPKHIKDKVFRIGSATRTFLSFGFSSFGIVSNFVLRYSDFHTGKKTIRLIEDK